MSKALLSWALVAVLAAGAVAALLWRGQPEGRSERYRQLTAELDRAFTAHDPDLLIKSAHAVRTFEASPGTPSSDPAPWRAEKLQLLLEAVDGARRGQDPHFNRDDLPSLNLVPPTRNGVAANSGVEPQAIQDLEARREYERLLQDNARKTTRYAYQITLRKLDADWTDNLKDHLAAQCASSSEDQKDLNALIDQCATVADDDKQKLRTLLIGNAVTAATVGSP
jgi:hypothetical protein